MATTWIGLALALVKLANMFFEWQGNYAREQIGGDRERLRQFQAMQAVSDTVKAVDERFDKMTDADVRDEITKQGDWRD